MRKSINFIGKALFFPLFFACSIAAPTSLRAADINSVNSLSSMLVDRAQQELDRIEPLVANGTLPKTALDEAKAKLTDAQDQEILFETLYGESHAENMADSQVEQMLAAAQRRVDRQQELLGERQKLFESGIIAQSELKAFQDELDSRQRVLQLAKSRAQLVHELALMAEAERQLEHASQQATNPALKNVMIRFGGNGLFSLSDLPTIATEFEKHFHSALPVSARGQTLVHQSMGLDHRNRVDVGLNPDSPEGVWLRHLLEHLQIPYLAFRAAVAGAATAPHIHIGPESTRLTLASR